MAAAGRHAPQQATRGAHWSHTATLYNMQHVALTDHTPPRCTTCNTRRSLITHRHAAQHATRGSHWSHTGTLHNMQHAALTDHTPARCTTSNTRRSLTTHRHAAQHTALTDHTPARCDDGRKRALSSGYCITVTTAWNILALPAALFFCLKFYWLNWSCVPDAFIHHFC